MRLFSQFLVGFDKLYAVVYNALRSQIKDRACVLLRCWLSRFLTTERFHKFFRYTMKYSSEPLVLSVATRWRSRTVKKKCEATMKAMFTCFWIVEPSEPRVEVWFGSMRVKDRNRTYWPKDPTFQRYGFLTQLRESSWPKM